MHPSIIKRNMTHVNSLSSIFLCKLNRELANMHLVLHDFFLGKRNNIEVKDIIKCKCKSKILNAQHNNFNRDYWECATCKHSTKRLANPHINRVYSNSNKIK